MQYILVFPIVLAIFFLIKLLLISKQDKAKKILAFYFLCFTIILITFLLLSHSSIEDNSITNIFSLLFYVAAISIPPTIFIYVFSLSDLIEIKGKDDNLIRHYYLPILLLIINTFSFIYLSSKSDESFHYRVSEDVMNYSNFIALLFIFPIMNVFYIYKTIKIYKLHNGNLNQTYSNSYDMGIKWMRHFILGYIIFIVLMYILIGSNTLSLNLMIPSTIFLTLYFMFIGYKAIKQDKIYFKQDFSESVLVLKDSSSSVLFDDDKRKLIKDSLIEYLINHKPYLDTNLTIHTLSKHINSNSKYVSMVINNDFNQNFVTFINSYRIEESKGLLKDEAYEQYTIEAIAKMSGFNSKSAFNNAFKQSQNITPSQFKNTHI
ncbi:MAG: AraC-like DNA-binding protein [Glaciecola sp.]|jgi:AraC-like DNA-binding protein